MFTQYVPNVSTCLTAKMETFDNESIYWKFEDLVQFWFENHTNLTKSEFNNGWIDPYDSIWLKLLTVILYAIEIFESLIMITFVNYETAGYFGHYRTLINQLLSHLYRGVSICPVTLMFKASHQFMFRFSLFGESDKKTKKSAVLFIFFLLRK